MRYLFPGCRIMENRCDLLRFMPWVGQSERRGTYFLEVLFSAFPSLLSTLVLFIHFDVASYGDAFWARHVTHILVGKEECVTRPKNGGVGRDDEGNCVNIPTALNRIFTFCSQV